MDKSSLKKKRDNVQDVVTWWKEKITVLLCTAGVELNSVTIVAKITVIATIITIKVDLDNWACYE